MSSSKALTKQFVVSYFSTFSWCRRRLRSLIVALPGDISFFFRFLYSEMKFHSNSVQIIWCIHTLPTMFGNKINGNCILDNTFTAGIITARYVGLVIRGLSFLTIIILLIILNTKKKTVVNDTHYTEKSRKAML